MNLQDIEQLNGFFTIEVRNAKGELIENFKEKNLIVNGAKNQLARLIAGDLADRSITQIGFGVGTDAPSPDNTGLTNAFFKSLTSISYPATGQVAFSWSLSTAEANGLAITEFGLRCADGTLFSRKTRKAIYKDEDISLTGTWTIIF